MARWYRTIEPWSPLTRLAVTSGRVAWGRPVALWAACVFLLTAPPVLHAQRAPGFSFWQQPTEEPGGKDVGIHAMPSTVAVQDGDIGQPRSVISSAFIEKPFPSPFGPGSLSGSPYTSFRISLPEPSLVSIRVYTALGQYIRTPLSTVYPAGRFDLVVDPGADLPTGVYVLTVAVGVSLHRFTVSYLR